MKKILIFLIKLYQNIFSPDKGLFKDRRQICVFYPTCSDYSISVIKKRGLFIGIIKSIKRVFRCHPWQKDFIDIP